MSTPRFRTVLSICMAEQYLHRAQVTCLLIDDRCLGSAKRMRPVVLPAQSDPGDPLINEPSILPSADMIGMIDPAWKDEVVERAAAAFEPCQNTAASGFEELELNGSAGLLLNDDRACTNPATADEIADLDFNDVASPELTVDREIEHRAVSKPPLSIQPEPDGPDLLWLQRAFAAKLPARVPWAPLFGARVIFRVSHCLSPLLATDGQ
jgi:hypothetical protein